MSGKRGGFSYIFLLLAVVFLSLSFILIHNITNTKRTAVNRDTKLLEARNSLYSSAAGSINAFYEKESADLIPGGNLRILNPGKDEVKAYNAYSFEYALASANRLKPLKLGEDVTIKGGVASSLPVYFDSGDVQVDAFQRWDPDEIFDKVDERFIEAAFDYIKMLKEDDTVKLHTISRSFSSEGEKNEITGTHYFPEGVRFGKNSELSEAVIISDRAVYFTMNSKVDKCNIFAPAVYILDDSVLIDCEIIVTGSIGLSHNSDISRTNIIAISLKAKDGFESCSVILSDESSFHGNILLIPQVIDNAAGYRSLSFEKDTDAGFSGKIINFGISEIKGYMEGSIYSGSFISDGIEDTVSGVTICRTIEPQDHFVFGIVPGDVRVY